MAKMNTRILVLDDNLSITRSCTKILTRAGYEVVPENSSLTALKLLEQDTFDMLLTDIRMPEMDGMALLTAVRKRDPYLSVVVITGFGTMDDAIKAMRLGAQGFLLKPYDPAELVAVVQETLQRRELIRDSIRLQTLLPLLELSDALYADKGAATLSEQALQVAAKEIVAGRLQLWLQQADRDLECVIDLTDSPDVPNSFTSSDLSQILERQQPLTKDKQGQPQWANLAARQIYSVGFPLLTGEKSLGVLVATVQQHSTPLSNFQLELLQVLSRQLAVAVQNVHLFQRVETLRSFNDNLIDNMSAGLIALDQHGDVTTLNKAASTLLQLKPEDTLSQPLATALACFPQLAEALLEPLHSDKPALIQRDLVLETREGASLIVTTTASALYDTNQSLTGVVGLVEDLTELKALEAESRRLDRLAALGEMSAVVAHELRNPIAGIAAGVEYLSKRIDSADSTRTASTMIQKEIQRVNRIIEDITMVARPLNLQKSYCTLAEIVETIQLRHQTQLQETEIRVVLQCQNDLPKLYLDLGRMEQVFDNLLTNAIAAMPQGGTIFITATKALNETPPTLKILFKDSGTGIKPAQQQKIFDPFFTTKNRGVGLGLALSRRILDGHGGRIDIFETNETGTTFEIHLPLARPAQAGDD